MRAASAAIITEQEALSKTSYIKLLFTHKSGSPTYDYSARRLQIEHHEAPYNAIGTFIILDDHDRSIEDITGYWVEIAYGYYTGNNVAEPHGDNAGNEYEYTPRLWVSSFMRYSAEGHAKVILNLKSAWEVLNEQLIMLGSPPLYYEKSINNTIYELLGVIFDEASSATGFTFTLLALGAADDGVINTYLPAFEMNAVEGMYNSMAQLISDLMDMTFCYLRAKYNLEFEVVYPQESDSDDETYYSYQAHYFKEYTEAVNVLLPNHVAVFAYRNEDGTWTTPPMLIGEALDQDAIDDYMEVLEPFLAPYITTQVDVDNRALVILARSQAEVLSGRLIIPHDCRVELYDRVKVYDTRGT